MRKEQIEFENEDSEKYNKLLAFELEIEKLKEDVKNQTLNYKNERFQRITLKENYDQILQTISKKNKI